eukprot:1047745-Prymnesium_polylepis.1
MRTAFQKATGLARAASRHPLMRARMSCPCAALVSAAVSSCPRQSPRHHHQATRMCWCALRAD